MSRSSVRVRSPAPESKFRGRSRKSSFWELFFKVGKRGESVIMFAVYDESGECIFHFRDCNKRFQGAEVQVVVKRVYSKRRICVAQIRKRVTGFVTVIAVANIGIKIKNSYRFSFIPMLAT